MFMRKSFKLFAFSFHFHLVVVLSVPLVHQGHIVSHTAKFDVKIRAMYCFFLPAHYQLLIIINHHLLICQFGYLQIWFHLTSASLSSSSSAVSISDGIGRQPYLEETFAFIYILCLLIIIYIYISHTCAQYLPRFILFVRWGFKTNRVNVKDSCPIPSHPIPSHPTLLHQISRAILAHFQI